VAGFGATLPEHLWYLFLPALTLALQLSAVLIRNLRSQVILTMRSDFVRTARAKGLPDRVVLFQHTVRNALLSTVTIFGLQFGFLLGMELAQNLLADQQEWVRILVALGAGVLGAGRWWPGSAAATC